MMVLKKSLKALLQTLMFGEVNFRVVRLFRGYTDSEFRPPHSELNLLTRTLAGRGGAASFSD